VRLVCVWLSAAFNTVQDPYLCLSNQSPTISHTNPTTHNTQTPTHNHSAPGLQAVIEGQLASEADKQFAACLAAPPDFDAAGATDPTVSLQRMASISVLQRNSPALAAARAEQPGGGAAPAVTNIKTATTTTNKPGELLRMPSIQQEKRNKKAEGWRKGAGDGGLTGLASEGSGAPGGAGDRWPSVSTAEGRAAIAELTRQAQEAGQWQLFYGCTNAVAALVGTGYLLLRAAGFNRRAPQAIEGLSSGLRRWSSLPVGSLARSASLPWGGGGAALAAQGGGGEA